MKLRLLALLGCVVFATSARAVTYSQVAPFVVPVGLAGYGFLALEDKDNKKHQYKNSIYSASALTALVGAAPFVTQDPTILKGAKIATVLVPAILSAYIWKLDSKPCAGDVTKCAPGKCDCFKVSVAGTLAAAALAYYVQ